MKEWKYYKPRFECDAINYELLRYAPWSGHRNFAYDLVAYFEPENIVELGSHYGCSSFAFMQAIKDFKLSTQFYAIDTWAGDDFTKNDYENDVYKTFKKTSDSVFDNNIHMLRMTFDEANSKFEDNSVDIIHIDGSHHYDDVKRDFESWLPKIKKDGIIILHDISEDIVLGDIMGSHKYWCELKEKFLNTIEFDFSWGLGVIFLSKEKYDEFVRQVDLKKYQRISNSLTIGYKDELRKNYFTLNDNKYYIKDLKEQLKIKNYHLEKYQNDIGLKENYICDLTNQIKDKDKILTDYSENVKGKDSYICDLESKIKEKDNILDDYAKNVQGKDNYIKELEEKIIEKDRYIEELSKIIENNKSYIKEMEEELEYFGQTIIGKIRKVFMKK